MLFIDLLIDSLFQGHFQLSGLSEEYTVEWIPLDGKIFGGRYCFNFDFVDDFIFIFIIICNYYYYYFYYYYYYFILIITLLLSSDY